MSKDRVSVVKDFLLRRMPWDLSRRHFIDLQREQIRDKECADPTFPDKLRQAALAAIASDKVEVIRRGLTALAFVGTRGDIAVIEKLQTYNDTGVRKDVRTCIFEIR